MKYTRIRVEFEEFEDRFNRVILVKGNPDLFKFATFLAFVNNAEFVHFYELSTPKEEYVASPYLCYPYDKTMKYLSNYSLKDLPNDFVFLYDSGENYKFNCHKEEIIDIDSKKDFILESAVGQGIWEDDSYALRAYLNDYLDPLENEEDEEAGIMLPWNFTNVTYGDFDEEIDIEEFNENISKNFSSLLSKLRKEDKKYIEKHYVSLEDVPPSYDKYNEIRYFEEMYMMSKW